MMLSSLTKSRFASTFALLIGLGVAAPEVTYAGVCSGLYASIFGDARASREHILSFAPGSRVRLPGESKPAEGTVVDHSLERVVVLLDSGRQVQLAGSKAASLVEVTPSMDVNSVAYRLWALRRKVWLVETRDLWSELISRLRTELADFKKLTKSEREAYLDQVGRQVMSDLKARLGAEELGFHFNLNGGVLEEYVDRGGILISRGDVALNYGHGDPNSKVYFFRSSSVTLSQILGASNPKLPFNWGRMGSALTVFRLDTEYFRKGFAEKGILNATDISLDFDEGWVGKQPLSVLTKSNVGIPATEFIAPPALVFEIPRKPLGLGLWSGRDEHTLVMMRYLERFWREFGVAGTAR